MLYWYAVQLTYLENWNGFYGTDNIRQIAMALCSMIFFRRTLQFARSIALYPVLKYFKGFHG